MLGYLSKTLLLTGIIAASVIQKDVISCQRSEEQLPDKPFFSAFEKIDISSFETVPARPNNLYSNSDPSTNIMILKNVAFGVTGAAKVTVGLNTIENENISGKLQFRIDNEDGQLISSIKLSQESEFDEVTGKVVPVKGYHDLYVTYSGEVKPANVSWFMFEISGPNEEEFYIITSRFNGRSVGIHLPSEKWVSAEPYGYGIHQMFSFKKTEFGSYYIKSRSAKNKFIEVEKGAFSKCTFVNVLFADHKPGQGQEWYIDPTKDGHVKIMSRLTGACLQVHPSDGYVYTHSCLNVSHQEFVFMPVC